MRKKANEGCVDEQVTTEGRGDSVYWGLLETVEHTSYSPGARNWSTSVDSFPSLAVFPGGVDLPALLACSVKGPSKAPLPENTSGRELWKLLVCMGTVYG